MLFALYGTVIRQFSAPHLAALAVLVTASVASVWVARTRPHLAIRVGYLLALAVFVAWVGEYVVDAANDTYSGRFTLPLQLTDAVSATTVIALWTRKRPAVELLFFWALSASLQALITPDLGEDFPSLYYFTYFVYHIGAVVAAVMLVFGCGMYPRRLGALKAFAATLAWAAAAGIGDILTGGNYMYLRAKPVHSSLLNLMGPWPWYLVSTGALALTMLLVLALIAEGVRRIDPRVRARAPGPSRPSSSPAASRTCGGSPAEPEAPSPRTAWSRRRGSARA
jgi:hypothetical integral membrane protein (TIGR02206 family)